eukprot:jgi/Mesvir1/4041/Mv25650-RA.1
MVVPRQGRDARRVGGGMWLVLVFSPPKRWRCSMHYTFIRALKITFLTSGLSRLHLPLPFLRIALSGHGFCVAGLPP